MSSFGVGLGSWKKGGRVADSSALTRMLKVRVQGQADATYTGTTKNLFRLSSAVLNTESYNSSAVVFQNIQSTG
ncbi:MAG: hypothetical protein EBU01_09310 [Crocinitomicaceae bacterium]|nr:hypothetical protein [Crocinitomicaceae bacterium]NCA20155.1 hypothetical protein [Crocinitomicaceae bacterium]